MVSDCDVSFRFSCEDIIYSSSAIDAIGPQAGFLYFSDAIKHPDLFPVDQTFSLFKIN